MYFLCLRIVENFLQSVPSYTLQCTHIYLYGFFLPHFLKPEKCSPIYYNNRMPLGKRYIEYDFTLYSTTFNWFMCVLLNWIFWDKFQDEGFLLFLAKYCYMWYIGEKYMLKKFFSLNSISTSIKKCGFQVLYARHVKIFSVLQRYLSKNWMRKRLWNIGDILLLFLFHFRIDPKYNLYKFE